MKNYNNLIKALEALTPEETNKISQLIKYDQSVPELILSIKIEKTIEEKELRK